MLLMESGDVLLSRAVSSQVPSALKGSETPIPLVADTIVMEER